MKGVTCVPWGHYDATFQRSTRSPANSVRDGWKSADDKGGPPPRHTFLFMFLCPESHHALPHTEGWFARGAGGPEDGQDTTASCEVGGTSR